MSLTSDKILNALLEGLSVDDLETILKQKRDKATSGNKPKPISKKQQLKNHYRELLIKRGNLFFQKIKE